MDVVDPIWFFTLEQGLLTGSNHRLCYEPRRIVSTALSIILRSPLKSRDLLRRVCSKSGDLAPRTNHFSFVLDRKSFGHGNYPPGGGLNIGHSLTETDRTFEFGITPASSFRRQGDPHGCRSTRRDPVKMVGASMLDPTFLDHGLRVRAPVGWSFVAVSSRAPSNSCNTVRSRWFGRARQADGLFGEPPFRSGHFPCFRSSAAFTA
jgi:hypothetical protein